MRFGLCIPHLLETGMKTRASSALLCASARYRKWLVTLVSLEMALACRQHVTAGAGRNMAEAVRPVFNPRGFNACAP